MKNQAITRRKFISHGLAATATFFIVPRFVLGGKNYVPPSDRIVLGFIGTGKQATGLQNVSITKRCHGSCRLRCGKLLERFKKSSEEFYAANRLENTTAALPSRLLNPFTQGDRRCGNFNTRPLACTQTVDAAKSGKTFIAKSRWRIP
jgi:hypothetical protein